MYGFQWSLLVCARLSDGAQSCSWVQMFFVWGSQYFTRLSIFFSGSCIHIVLLALCRAGWDVASFLYFLILSDLRR